MVIATLMTVLIHGCVIDSLIDVGRGRRISKETAPKITAPKIKGTTSRTADGKGPVPAVSLRLGCCAQGFLDCVCGVENRVFP